MTVYAGFWIRLLASIIDSILLSAASWILSLLFAGLWAGVWFWYMKIIGGALDPETSATFLAIGAQALVWILYSVLSLVYYIWGQCKYGTTFAKSLFKIRVVDAKTLKNMDSRQALVRYIGYTVSSIIFGIGYLMAAWDPQKRALHDRMAGTVSIIV